MYASMLQVIADEHIGDMRRAAASRRRGRAAMQAARQQPKPDQERTHLVPESPEVVAHAARERELTGARH